MLPIFWDRPPFQSELVFFQNIKSRLVSTIPLPSTCITLHYFTYLCDSESRCDTASNPGSIVVPVTITDHDEESVSNIGDGRAEPPIII